MVRLGQRGTELKALLRTPPFGAHLNSMTMQAEEAPQLANRVDLDPDVKDINGLPVARVTHKQHAWELATRRFYTPKLIEILGASGAQFGFVSPVYDGGVTPTSAHNMGVLRMGSDPRTSVTDGWGKFHDLDNLYCADGSLFPTGSRPQPDDDDPRLRPARRWRDRRPAASRVGYRERRLSQSKSKGTPAGHIATEIWNHLLGRHPGRLSSCGGCRPLRLQQRALRNLGGRAYPTAARDPSSCANANRARGSLIGGDP